MNSRELFSKITEKWPVKILSLAAALLISFFYKMSTLETRFFSAPLHIESADLLVPASFYPQSVKINIRGEKNSIYTILEEDVEAYIDFNKYAYEDTYRIPVQIRKKGSVLGIEPIEITVEPADILIKLENKTSRTVEISPSFRGFFAEGYEMLNQMIIPSSVTVEGPRSNVQALQEINTAEIDLDGRNRDFSIMINIINNDSLIVIHGNKMIEYRAVIRQISRGAPSPSPARIFDEADEQ
jgi:YbbR domain-containing protein